MSQHAIEDVIERAIHLVDRSTQNAAHQAALIHALLHLQARYDTGLTWLRMHEVLLRHDVLVRTPVEAIDDAALRAQARAAETSCWLESDRGTGYLHLEENASVLYQQTGTGHAMPVSALFRAVLTLADQADDGELFTNFYGLLVNGWLDATFTAEDGLASSLDGLVACDDLQAIRGIAARRGLKRRRGVSEDLALPHLSESQEPGEIEQNAGLRFFLQPKRAPTALLAARNRTLRQLARVQELIPMLVEQRLSAALQQAGWSAVAVQPEHPWCWTRDRDGSRQCLWATHDATCGELIVQAGLQHARLLDWQQRSATTQLHDLHIYDRAAPLLGEHVLNPKDIGTYGGLRLDPAHSDAQLGNAFDRLAAALPALDVYYFDVIAQQLSGPFFDRDLEMVMRMMEEGHSTGAIAQDVLLASPESTLLAFVFHHLEHGDDVAAAAVVERVRARHAARTRQNAWHRAYLSPFLQQWDRGRRDMPMPPVQHVLLLNHLRACESV